MPTVSAVVQTVRPAATLERTLRASVSQQVSTVAPVIAGDHAVLTHCLSDAAQPRALWDASSFEGKLGAQEVAERDRWAR